MSLKRYLILIALNLSVIACTTWLTVDYHLKEFKMDCIRLEGTMFSLERANKEFKDNILSAVERNSNTIKGFTIQHHDLMRDLRDELKIRTWEERNP